MASGNVVVSQSSISNCPESNRIHLMACEIGHDGDAAVAAYFDSTIREQGSCATLENGAKTLSASFRGHGLNGSVVKLPAGYKGYVMNEDKKPLTDEEERVIRACRKFSQFMYWNLETPPSSNDAVIKAMQWINIASALHSSETDNQYATPENIR